MRAIEIDNLCFGYEKRLIFENFSLEIHAGEFFGVIGPNGSGKSTLLRLIGGIVSPASGAVRVFGKNVNHLSRRATARIMALVPQESLFAFDWTVREVVMMGRNPFLRFFENPGRADVTKVEQAMRLTDVLTFADKSINAISAGEKQRVILARALAQEPQVLLLDEATSHLDVAHRMAIWRILKDLNRQGRTIIFVSHDLNEAALCSRVLLLSGGKRVACDIPERVITPEWIEAAYGVKPVVTAHPVSGKPQVLLPPA